jgi:hypothetical protein
MLAELLEQNHRQQVGPGPSPGDHVEGGRCLADLLAIPAGELLPHRFDHLPLARDRLQGPGHVLAQLAQPRSATTIASRRRIDHHALAREVVGEGVSFGALAGESRHRRGLGDGDFRGEFIFGGARFQFLELQRQLIDEPGRSLRARAVDLTLQLGDPQLLMGDQGQVFGRLGPRHRQFRGTSVAFGDHFPHPGALDRQRRFQRVDVVRQGCKIGVHDKNRIMNPAR